MLKKIKLWHLNRKLMALAQQEAYMRQYAKFYAEEANDIRRVEMPALEAQIEKLEIEIILDNGGHA